MIIVFLLVGALTRNTSDLAEVASTAIGGIFRNLATMLVAVVVLILLVVAVANGAADPGISTVAPGEQADAPAADPGGPADGDGVAVG
ncbi:hypothetical protein [Pseudonocardia abyssalis]|uniref:Uncharacterized protein n=2 Tax=Pseudonocardia abyssalis TaxID=2792008 RepID=A0ABS6UTA7_9PSEU|nr:hypothetical protein [Pseudonocardia abyssalis]MBW0135490.1 hypothetical protein [Pseudonocardia abyssalis]